MDLFTISAVLTLETARFASGIRTATNQGANFASTLQNKVSAGTIALGNLIADATKAAGRAVVQMGREALNLTGELEQNLGGSEAVFGEWAENIQDKARQAFSASGLSMSDYLSTANKMGSLFKGSGFTTAEAFDMTSQAMQRAADVASIMGISTESAMESVAGMAKGNFTMMDNLGVAINDTTLAIYAQEKGIKKSTRSMSNAEKVGLAYQMFMEKTASYAGNYAKENDTLAGSLSTAKAAFDNFMSGGGTVDDFVDSTLNAGSVIIRNIGEIAPRLFNGTKEAMAKAWPKVKAGLSDFWDNDAPGIVTNGANGVISTINAVFGTNIPKIDKIELPKSEEISATVSAWWSGERSLVQDLCDWTLGIFGFPDTTEIKTGVINWWEGTKKAFEDSLTWTVQMFGFPDTETAKAAIAEWWSPIADWFNNTFFPNGAGPTAQEPIKVDYTNPDSYGSAEAMYNPYTTPEQEAIIQAFLSGDSEQNLQNELDDMDLNATASLTVHVQEEVTNVASSAINGILSRGAGGGGTNRVQKYATGLNYVPYNDFPASLHEGEAVLTKNQAEQWRKGIVSNQSAGIDYDQMATALRSVMSGMTVQMDGHAVGVLVTPTVSAEIGRQGKSRRYTG